MESFTILWDYRYAFLDGMLVSFELITLACVIGTLLGIGLEWLASRNWLPLRRLLNIATLAVIAVPALVLLFWLYYPAQTLLGVSISPFWTAVTALVLMNTAGVYRILADAMKEFPRQYLVTAQICGMKQRDIVRYITAPILIRATLPRWLDLQVVVLQTSVFASLISVPEIFRVAQRVNSVEYEPVASFTAMAVLFALVAGSGIVLAQTLRRRFDRDQSER